MSPRENSAAHAAGLPWVVEVTIDAVVVLPEGVAAGRDELHAWLWEQTDGLLGIDEGSLTVADAAACGLVSTPNVIDAAAAPAGRDWVARLAVATERWWFRDEAAARDAVALAGGVGGCRVVGVRVDVPIDHEAASRASFGPIAIAGFGVVRPAWEEGAAGSVPDGEATIFIEPGTGFGTGLHETTQMCLAAVAERQRRGPRFEGVLDFGSGSGILGIAAAVLGAARVDAVEIDDRVHPAIRTNARRNGVAERLRVARGLAGWCGPYDLVVANIVPQVLVAQAVALCGRMNPRGGNIVLSGVRAAEAGPVAERYAALIGSRPLVQERGEWRCLSFTRG